MPLNGLTGSVLVLHDLTGSTKDSVNADLLIYSSFVTVSGQCMSVAIIISNKMDFNFAHTWRVFVNPVTYI